MGLRQGGHLSTKGYIALTNGNLEALSANNVGLQIGTEYIGAPPARMILLLYLQIQYSSKLPLMYVRTLP